MLAPPPLVLGAPTRCAVVAELPDAVVDEVELCELLPHPAATMATSAEIMTSTWYLCFTTEPLHVTPRPRYESRVALSNHDRVQLPGQTALCHLLREFVQLGPVWLMLTCYRLPAKRKPSWVALAMRPGVRASSVRAIERFGSKDLVRVLWRGLLSVGRPAYLRSGMG